MSNVTLQSDKRETTKSSQDGMSAYCIALVVFKSVTELKQAAHFIGLQGDEREKPSLWDLAATHMHSAAWPVQHAGSPPGCGIASDNKSVPTLDFFY